MAREGNDPNTHVRGSAAFHCLFYFKLRPKPAKATTYVTNTPIDTRFSTPLD